MSALKKLFKEYFLTGLLLIGPLAICVVVFKSIAESADSLLQTSQWAPLKIPGLGILIAIGVILLTGFLGKNYLGSYIFKYTSQVLERIPFVGGLYKSLRQVFETIFSGQERRFTRTVIIPFPSAQFQCIALVVSETIPVDIQKKYNEPMLSVFVPNSPLPTNGFYLFVRQKDALPTDISVEDALKMVVSIGLVVPHGN